MGCPGSTQVVAAVRAGSKSTSVPAGAQGRAVEFGGTASELDEVLDGVDRVFLMRPP